MSVVTLLGVQVLNNPAKFTDKYVFEITFECLEELHKDLEWKLTYVGSATSDQYDQELDSLAVGPIPVGVNKFIFEADAPDISRILDADLLGVTVILLTCTYDEREFVRVGYYVNNEYDSEELNADPPAKPLIERIRRNVLAEKPRVTRFAIKWDSDASAPAEFPPDQPEADLAPDDDEYGADEVDEDDEEVVEEVVEAPGEDAAMGDDNAEVSDDGSEDIEGESEDDFDEEEEEEVAGDDAMDVDMTDSQPHPVTASH
ncbi:hypothetical protein TD95_000895 [Thielaviopsis punctulata]|uniref:Histone chaperone n=1 Tax=Thielaviopsis punctulata TaxID=72032 RepID=A0A0F4ZGD7_9PEZI|nr:hypothetical protein TD95_000895 [Thielaviopsis punctulata]